MKVKELQREKVITLGACESQRRAVSSQQQKAEVEGERKRR